MYDETEKIEARMRKRRVTFYAYLKRMKKDRLSKRIFEFFDKNLNTPLTWFKQGRADLIELKITQGFKKQKNV